MEEMLGTLCLPLRELRRRRVVGYKEKLDVHVLREQEMR